MWVSDVHIDSTIGKTKPAFHAVVQLKKARVNSTNLAPFYRSRSLSALPYAAPCYCPLISNVERDRLERYQRLYIRIILPHVECYQERLEIINLSTLEKACMSYVRKPASRNHPLHHLVPVRSYNIRTAKSNTHTGKPKSLKCRSALLDESLF